MNINLLNQLSDACAVSGDEQEVRDILCRTLEPCVDELTFDGPWQRCRPKRLTRPESGGGRSQWMKWALW